MRLCIFMVLVGIAWPVLSQPRKGKKKERDAPVEAFFPQQEYGPPASGSGLKLFGRRIFTKKEKGITRQAKARYEEREAVLAKRARRSELSGEKIKNTDPRYFGHRKIPRKRPTEKMKYCKVCGIRH